MRFRDIITEGVQKVEVAHDGRRRSSEVLVVENPTSTQVSNFLARRQERARFIIAQDGTFYMWNANSAIHSDMAKALGLVRYAYGGLVYPEGLGMRYGEAEVARVAPEIRAFPSVKVAFGPDVAIEHTDDDW